jgi:hypothetical protein
MTLGMQLGTAGGIRSISMSVCLQVKAARRMSLHLVTKTYPSLEVPFLNLVFRWETVFNIVLKTGMTFFPFFKKK